MISVKENQNQYQFFPTTAQTEAASSSCASLLNALQDQGSMHEEYHLLPQQQPQEPHDCLSLGGSRNSHAVGQTNQQCSVKWMSSKMRLIRKALGSDQILVNKQRRTRPFNDQVPIVQASSSSNMNSGSNNDVIRICSNCKTTKTPLWRGGPQGPKSLCNACGIRQMKARRAMRAAAAGSTTAKMQEERRSDVDRTVPFKKRFKINVPSASAQKQLTINLANNSAFQQTFPQEEKDAALLLMALHVGSWLIRR